MHKMTLFVFWAILICTFCSRQIEDLMKVRIVLDEKTRAILYTSKPMGDDKSEDNMIKVTLRDGQEEEYVIVDENGVTSHVFVKAKAPFMEGQVKEQLELKESTRVFRVLDVEQFQSTMPRLILLAVLLIAMLGLWIYFGVKGGRMMEQKKQWLVVCATMIVLTWIFARVTASIELPSSLLPPENIFDWKYYVSEFKYF